MKAYLFPYRLLASNSAYISALSPDPDRASHALQVWLDGIAPDDITRPEQKLIGIMASRFVQRLQDHPLTGVFQNIQRQNRMRAHVNIYAAKKLLNTNKNNPFEFVALGETRETFASDAQNIVAMDTIEFALDLAYLDTVLLGLLRAGWTITNPLRRAWGRSAKTIMLKDKRGSPLRLVGVSNIMANLQPSDEFTNLYTMTTADHFRFMCSKSASLIARSDQFLFDFYDQKLTQKQKSEMPQAMFRVLKDIQNI